MELIDWKVPVLSIPKSSSEVLSVVAAEKKKRKGRPAVVAGDVFFFVSEFENQQLPVPYRTWYHILVRTTEWFEFILSVSLTYTYALGLGNGKGKLGERLSLVVEINANQCYASSSREGANYSVYH